MQVVIPSSDTPVIIYNYAKNGDNIIIKKLPQELGIKDFE